MPDFTKLWNRIYLLGPNPLNLSRSDYIFFWVAVSFVVLGIVAKVWAMRAEATSPHRYLFARLFHSLVTMGIFILLWAGARFENIPYLSLHIVVLFLFLIFLIWLGFIAKYFFGGFLRQRKIWADEMLKRKYLPR